MGVRREALLSLARAVTVIVAIPAIIVASRAESVLYVFLIADLIGAAIAVPMLAGLYSGRMPGWAVLLAGGAGIIIGALFYPRPRPDLALGIDGAVWRADVLCLRRGAAGVHGPLPPP